MGKKTMGGTSADQIPTRKDKNMKKKQFKTESKKLLDMMVNSIYTHREIFLRELISNASDAIDKLYYRSLGDSTVGLDRSEYAITLAADKDARILTISDNGIGMTEEELENNLGTIAKSGSYDFKKNNEAKENVDIIGQFGVGFYSAFMVADRIVVESRPYGATEAFRWESDGADGYTVVPCEKDSYGTVITLYLKPDTEDEKYGEFLDEYRLRHLVKKYSDYIRYPIKMLVTEEKPVEGKEGETETVSEWETLNSMVPLWRKNPSEVTEEEYNGFYRDTFYDFEAPLRVIHARTEGMVSFDTLMFLPKNPPYDYYSGKFEKGLALYSGGVMIMEKCADLLPDYFGFVRGMVDSADLSLNISRELLQHDRQLKVISRAIEKKIKTEMEKMLADQREKYEELFRAFGLQLKYGVYADYGMHKDVLKDLILFVSSTEKKYVSLKEYVARMGEEQKHIYYAAGETVDKIDMLPRVEAAKAKGYEVLYLTDDVDEFALKMLGAYAEKEFMNVCDNKLELGSEEEQAAVKAENEAFADLLTAMKEAIGESVHAVRFTADLKNHPVCLTTEGELSTEMEKVLNSMPGSGGMAKAQVVLEINVSDPIAEKLKTLYHADKAKLTDYAKVLYAQARLIGGMTVENPAEISALICRFLAE